MHEQRPVWAEIKLDDIIHNYCEVRRLVGPAVQVMAIVKANAYGHGAVKVTQTLAEAGADRFGVAIVNEAVELRENGIDKPILVLGWTPPDDYRRALRHRIALTLYSAEEARVLSRVAQECGQPAHIHLKIDTGMGRIGLPAGEEGLAHAASIVALPGLVVEGIFTHLAKADEREKTYTKRQMTSFLRFCEQLKERTGCRPPLRHAANSAAVIDHPEAHLDMIRPGIILYGLKPSSEVNLDRIELRQALSLRARVSLVKEVPPGTSISYGGCYVTSGPARIATLPIGYADGYSRLLSGKAQVIAAGERAPLVGRVCMDQVMFDATGLPRLLLQGDTVTLIGREGHNFIPVDELAEILGTINYELVCMISARVPRIYT